MIDNTLTLTERLFSKTELLLTRTYSNVNNLSYQPLKPTVYVSYLISYLFIKNYVLISGSCTNETHLNHKDLIT